MAYPCNNIRILSLSVIIMLVSVSALFASMIPVAHAQVVVKISSPRPDGTWIYDHLNELAAELTAEVDGNMVRFEVDAPSIDFFDRNAVMQKIGDGSVTMAAIPIQAIGAQNSHYYPFLEFFQFRNLREAEDIKMDLDLTEVNNNGDPIFILNQWHSGMVFLISDKEIYTSDDLNGMRIASGLTGEVGDVMFDSVGAEPIRLSSMMERVRAFSAETETEIINAFEVNPVSLMQQRNIRFNQPSYILPPHGYQGYLLVINRQAWEDFSDYTKNVMLQSIGDFTNELNASVLQQYYDIDGMLTELASDTENLTVVDYNDGQFQSLKEVFRTIGDKVLDGMHVVMNDRPRPAAEVFDFRPLAGGGFPSAPQQEIVREADPDPAANPDRGLGEASFPLGVFWNTWLSYGSSDVRVIDASKRNPHQVHLDLSPYHYQTLFDIDRVLGSGVAGDAMKNLLAEYADEDEVEIRVRAFEVDGTLSIQGDVETTLKIKLKRLLSGSDEPTSAASRAYKAVSSNQPQPLMRFSTAVSAANATFMVKPKVGSGQSCGRIGFSILDAQMVLPIDYAILTIPIRSAKSDSIPDCRSTLEDKALFVTGAEALLASVIDYRRYPERKADAALQIFETTDSRNQPVTIVTFVDGMKDPPDILVWRTASSFSEYVTNGLARDVRVSRGNARNGGDAPYANTANNLRMKLFTGYDFENCGDDDTFCPSHRMATKAANRLRVMTNKEHRTVTVRATNAHKRPMFVPFGILAADTAGTDIKLPFETPVTIVQPLPRGRYHSRDTTCVGNWNFAVPESLAEAKDTTVVDSLQDISRVAGGTGNWYPTQKAFSDYFSASGTSNPVSSTEGLVVLAHHDSDGFWFQKIDENSRVMREGRKRNYPPGSAAFLAACSAADTLQTSSTIVEELNAKKIDTIIASPFAVEAEFGAQLAVEFIQLVDAARSSNSKPTIKSVFEKAALNAASKMASDEKMERAMKQTALEYILLGDPGLRVCGG